MTHYIVLYDLISKRIHDKNETFYNMFRVMVHTCSGIATQALTSLAVTPILHTTLAMPHSA